MFACLLVCACLCVCMCAHVCVQNNTNSANSFTSTLVLTRRLMTNQLPAMCYCQPRKEQWLATRQSE